MGDLNVGACVVWWKIEKVVEVGYWKIDRQLWYRVLQEADSCCGLQCHWWWWWWWWLSSCVLHTLRNFGILVKVCFVRTRNNKDSGCCEHDYSQKWFEACRFWTVPALELCSTLVRVFVYVHTVSRIFFRTDFSMVQLRNLAKRLKL